MTETAGLVGRRHPQGSQRRATRRVGGPGAAGDLGAQPGVEGLKQLTKASADQLPGVGQRTSG
jgi:hypothetical protein